MDIRELVQALSAGDALAARQWVADAEREQLRWPEMTAPQSLSTDEMAVAAGVVELLAHRAGQSPPPWTAGVQAASRAIFLVRAAAAMPRLRRLCEEEGPEPLRRRRVFAPPGFLTAA
jgi:hypothetical protein